MALKTTAALLAAVTLAFATPAFADQTPPADSSVQTEGYIAFQPAEQLNTPIATETNTTTFYQETPLQIESEVAGEVIINEDAYIPPQEEGEPILGDRDFVPEIDSNLDGFDEDNSQFQVDDAKTTITFGAR